MTDSDGFFLVKIWFDFKREESRQIDSSKAAREPVQAWTEMRVATWLSSPEENLPF